MPKTAAEIDALLATIKAIRDGVDASASTVAGELQTSAATLDGEAVALETQSNALDLKEPDQQMAYRRLSAQAGSKRQQAARGRMNAARMLSVGHAAEKANDVEVCIHCTP